jgi:hypothetical protein
VLLAALLIAALPPALSAAELAERAESEFREGVRLRAAADQARPHFRAAADAFEQLRRQGIANPALYHDLGSAYLLAGDLPHAILSYRRGLEIAPHDLTLRRDLAEARDRVVYPERTNLGRPPADTLPPWLPHLPPSWLWPVAVLFYGLSWVGLTRWRMTHRPRPLALAGVALVGAVLLAIVLFVWARSRQEEFAHPLVVIAEDGVLLRKGNGLAFPPRYDTPVNRGVEARLLFERGNWVQIELSGGEVGWIPRAYALID